MRFFCSAYGVCGISRWRIALHALVLCALGWFMVRYGARVLATDAFGYVPAFGRWVTEGKVDFLDLLAQENQHRPFVPMLLITAFLVMGGWENGLMLVPVCVTGALNAVLVYHLVTHTLGPRREGVALLQLTVWMLMLSWHPYSNWIMAFQLQFHLVLFGTLIAVGSLVTIRGRWRAVAVAFAGCMIATLSLGNGILSWIVVLPLLCRRFPSRYAVWAVASWMVLTMVIAAFYLRGLAVDAALTSVSLHTMIVFFLTVTGLPVIQHALWSPLAGTMLLAICVPPMWIAWRQRRAEALPWVALACFGLGTHVLLVLTRAQAGVFGALFPRYAHIAMLVPVSGLLLWALAVRRMGWMFQGMLLLLVMNIVRMNIAVVRGAYYLNVRFAQGQACMQMYDRASARCLAQLYVEGSGEQVRSAAALLHHIGWFTPFTLPADVQWEPDARGYGYLEYVDRALATVDAPAGYRWNGWATLPSCARTRHIVLTAGAARRVIAHTTAVVRRDDVAVTHGNRCRYSGFTVEADETIWRPGEPVQAWVYHPAHRTMYALGALQSYLNDLAALPAS